MEKKVTLLDGAVGTVLFDIAAAHGIDHQKEPVWTYNLTHPEFVVEMTRSYIDAGSEYIMANTFAANRPTVAHYSDLSVAEIVKAAVRIARETTAGTGVKVGLDIGALPEMLDPYGDLEEDECEEIFEEQIGAAFEEGGIDAIFLMTFMDIEMAVIAARVALRYGVPVFVTMTFAGGGRTIMGNSVEQIVSRLEPMGIHAIGMNCSLGPVESLPILKEFREKTDLPLIFKPNSGMVTASGGVVYTAEQFVEEMTPALEIASYVGGCCGCDADYIRALKQKIE